MGILGVLHTWTRTLAYHPHVHCLVPAGGVSADRTEWRPARPSSLGPVQALSQRFRGLFLELLRQERPDLTIPKSVWTNGWVVSCNPAVQGPAPVLPSLGRYVHRMALTNRRRLSIDDEQVCCRYPDSQTSRWHTMPLPAQECIRRFLPHVWPQGFHQVRDYGLWSPVPRPLLHQLQLWLAAQHPPAPLASPDRERQSSGSSSVPLQAGQLCPSCGQGWLVVIRQLPRHPRGPP
jgi:Putative transposase